MRTRLLVPLFAVVLSVPSWSQSFNIDFEPATSASPPSATFGAAAQSPGHWNSVSSLPVSGLLSLSGAATGVGVATSSHPSNFYFWSIDDPGTSGDDEALLDDLFADDTDQFHMIVTGLETGEYDVYTYLLVPAFNACFIEVMGSPDGIQQVSGSWNGAYALGGNYARHHKSVTDGTLDVRVQQTGPHGQMVIATNGIQIVRTDGAQAGTPMCFGDGSVAACPCLNTGGQGRGCQNSANTGGAELAATGTTTPDTVVLQSSGELPTALSIFFQGNASVGPLPYGDGLRCTGGTLRRLYTKSATSGLASAPGPGDMSITDRSAALGVPIPADGRRYYQVYYRDANPAFCSAPAGNTFNITNAVRINW